jgi:hypothetical protein
MGSCGRGCGCGCDGRSACAGRGVCCCPAAPASWSCLGSYPMSWPFWAVPFGVPFLISGSLAAPASDTTGPPAETGTTASAAPLSAATSADAIGTAIVGVGVRDSVTTSFPVPVASSLTALWVPTDVPSETGRRITRGPPTPPSTALADLGRFAAGSPLGASTELCITHSCLTPPTFGSMQEVLQLVTAWRDEESKIDVLTNRSLARRRRASRSVIPGASASNKPRAGL